MPRLPFGTLLGLVACALPAVASSQVRVWAGTMDLPVYTEGAPDQNPPFDQFGGPINYPYALRQDISDRKKVEHLRAVYLENEYLKCSILPDLGGHLYTCIDKLSGRPMFYANPSIKKARIGYRGAWAAFGDEFNFPVSHNWVSLSPVNFAYAAHTDGSASVTVGNIDRVYGMEWTVEMVLQPGSTVLEEKVTLSNRTDVRHRFYWWNNAGVEVWEDSRICYPTKFTQGHGFSDIDTWPVDTHGFDLSVVRNQQDGPVSRFVYGSREPYIGVWHPHTDTGIVHYADYGTLPGKKFWSWGDDAPGREWRRILSDNNSTYVEVQAGPFRNQETYAFLQPRQSMRFSEYWIPVRGLGGIARANLAGALNLDHKDGKLNAAINVNRKLPGATIRVLDGATNVFEERADLSPETTWHKQLPLREPTHSYTLQVSDAAGEVVIAQTEGVYDVSPAADVQVGPQSHYVFPEPAKRTADDWLQLGDLQELNGDLLGALTTYQAGLQVTPTSLSLTKAAGRLLTSLLRFDEATPLLEAAYARNTTDGEIAYYLGLSYAGAGRERRAREMFDSASRMHGVDAAAHLQLAEMASRRGDLNDAEVHLLAALALSPNDLRTIEEQAAVLGALNEKERAHAYAIDASARFPNSLFLREQLGTPDLAHLAADPYRVLGLASEYMRLGMYAPALAVLSREYPAVPSDQIEPGAVLPQQHATVLYYRAYCKSKLGQPAAVDDALAAKTSTRNVFPHDRYDSEVFRAATAAEDADANAHYLLGMEEFSRGRTDTALPEWNKAAALNPHIPSLFTSVGRFELKSRKDSAAALTAFTEARKNDPTNAEAYIGLNQSLSLLQRSASERSAALESFPDQTRLPQSLVYELALTKAEASDNAGAQAAFRNRFFASGEGDTDVRNIWVEVKLQHAQDLARSHQCKEATKELGSLGAPNSALPFTQHFLPAMITGARTLYMSGTIEKACGHEAAANTAFTSAEKATAPDEILWAAQAAQQLQHYEANAWHDRLEQAHTAALAKMTSADAGYWTYVAAMLERDLGQSQLAETHLEDGLRLPDRQLSYHLIRLARESTAAAPANTGSPAVASR